MINDKDWQLDRQQAAKGLGHSVSRGTGSRPRADDDGQGAEAGRAVTISIDDTATGGVLHIDWGTQRASIPFTVG